MKPKSHCPVAVTRQIRNGHLADVDKYIDYVSASEGSSRHTAYRSRRDPSTFPASRYDLAQGSHAMPLESRVLSALFEHYVAVTVVAFTAYTVVLVGHRLFLSPLAKFPGPKIAAVTSWYEFYHDYFRRGKYVFKIKEMHDKYGKWAN